MEGDWCCFLDLAVETGAADALCEEGAQRQVRGSVFWLPYSWLSSQSGHVDAQWFMLASSCP